MRWLRYGGELSGLKQLSTRWWMGQLWLYWRIYVEIVIQNLRICVEIVIQIFYGKVDIGRIWYSKLAGMFTLLSRSERSCRFSYVADRLRFECGWPAFALISCWSDNLTSGGDSMREDSDLVEGLSQCLGIQHWRRNNCTQDHRQWTQPSWGCGLSFSIDVRIIVRMTIDNGPNPVGDVDLVSVAVCARCKNANHWTRRGNMQSKVLMVNI